MVRKFWIFSCESGRVCVFPNACCRWSFPFCADCCLISTRAALIMARMESGCRSRESARMLDSVYAAMASVLFWRIAWALPRSLRMVAISGRSSMSLETFSPCCRISSAESVSPTLRCRVPNWLSARAIRRGWLFSCAVLTAVCRSR